MLVDFIQVVTFHRLTFIKINIYRGEFIEEGEFIVALVLYWCLYVIVQRVC